MHFARDANAQPRIYDLFDDLLYYKDSPPFGGVGLKQTRETELGDGEPGCKQCRLLAALFSLWIFEDAWLAGKNGLYLEQLGDWTRRRACNNSVGYHSFDNNGAMDGAETVRKADGQMSTLRESDHT